MPTAKTTTQLLLDARQGDKAALDQLMPLVYQELRRLAARYLRRERAVPTLQATALVHEAYVRLVDQSQVRWQDRAHFFALAAQVMRRILIDRARGQQAVKRNPAGLKLTLEDAVAFPAQRAIDLFALDDALTGLATKDPQKSRIVELRFFGGLSIEETAEVLGVSTPTVIRQWRTARAWLYREITGEDHHGS